LPSGVNLYKINKLKKGKNPNQKGQIKQNNDAHRIQKHKNKNQLNFDSVTGKSRNNNVKVITNLLNFMVLMNAQHIGIIIVILAVNQTILQ